MGNWMMLIEIEKVKNNDWYGFCAFLRRPTGFCIIIDRSLSVDCERYAQLIILCEAFVRLKEIDVSKINCRDPKSIWRKLLDPDTIYELKFFSSLC